MLREGSAQVTRPASGAGAGPAKFWPERFLAYFNPELSRLVHHRAGSTRFGNKINEFNFQYARRGLLYSFSRGPGGSDVAVNIPGFASLDVNHSLLSIAPKALPVHRQFLNFQKHAYLQVRRRREPSATDR
jgi:hypothetical protein